MALIHNGVNIERRFHNGVEIKKHYHNGVLVWQGWTALSCAYNAVRVNVIPKPYMEYRLAPRIPSASQRKTCRFKISFSTHNIGFPPEVLLITNGSFIGEILLNGAKIKPGSRRHYIRDARNVLLEFTVKPDPSSNLEVRLEAKGDVRYGPKDARDVFKNVSAKYMEI